MKKTRCCNRLWSWQGNDKELMEESEMDLTNLQKNLNWDVMKLWTKWEGALRRKYEEFTGRSCEDVKDNGNLSESVNGRKWIKYLKAAGRIYDWNEMNYWEGNWQRTWGFLVLRTGMELINETGKEFIRESAN